MSIKSYFLALIVVIIWAYNTVLVKLGVAEIPPLFLTTLRFIVVALMTVPFTRIDRKDIKLLILLAFTFGFMHFSLIFIALSYAEAGISAIFVQLGTPFAIIIASVIFKEQLKIKQLIGIIVSFYGILVLFGSPDMPGIVPSIFLVSSALGWAITNVIIKKQTSNMTPLTLIGWSSLFAVPLVGFLSFLFEHDHISSLVNAGWTGWSSLFYSAIVSSIFSYSLWYWLLQKYPINSIIPLSLLSPVFSVFFGIVILNESFDANKILGSCLVVAGIFFATIDFKILLIKRYSNKI